MKIIPLQIFILCFVVGCAALQPEVDECASYDKTVKKSYCYLSKEVTTLRQATAQSLKDGVITVDKAIKIRDALNRADAYLDTAELAILTFNDVQAEQSLAAVKTLLVNLR